MGFFGKVGKGNGLELKEFNNQNEIARLLQRLRLLNYISKEKTPISKEEVEVF